MRPLLPLIGVLIGLVLGACSAAGLQDLEPCTAPTVIVVPSGATDSEIEDAYGEAVVEGIEAIIAESLRFSGRHPDRKLSNNANFRRDYVNSEQQNVCQATNLIELQPPAEYLEAFHEQLSDTLSEYIKTMTFGHAAVKARNVSDFRAWDGRENSSIERLTIARDNIPEAP